VKEAAEAVINGQLQSAGAEGGAIFRVAQWHGIVTRVDFLNADGRVVETVKEGR
jgi:hypothetical protein